MMESRARQLGALLDGRPVRAVPQPGDYDGRERTIEVFDADAKEQRRLLRRLRAVRAELDATTGGPVVFVFHTRKESARLYSGFIDEWAEVLTASSAVPEKTAAAMRPRIDASMSAFVHRYQEWNAKLKETFELDEKPQGVRITEVHDVDG